MPSNSSDPKSFRQRAASRIEKRAELVAVTGGAGFIGSYVAKILVRMGVPATKILAVDEPNLFGERICTASLRAARVACVSPQEFLASLESLRPQMIFHLGACSNTEETRKDYLQRVNVEYSQRLWRYAAAARIPLLYASSAATYGAGEWGFGDDPALMPKLRPLNLYGESKLAFDLFALEQSAAGAAPPQWAGFKFFNVYGPGEEHKGRQASVVWHARAQVNELGSIRLFKSYRPEVGHGEQTRDFVYVGDVADVMLAFVDAAHAPGIYNVGTGCARSFNDLAAAVGRALQRKVPVEYIEMPASLQKQYQYHTEAALGRLRTAGYSANFCDLNEGVERYFREIAAPEKPEGTSL